MQGSEYWHLLLTFMHSQTRKASHRHLEPTTDSRKEQVKRMLPGAHLLQGKCACRHTTAYIKCRTPQYTGTFQQAWGDDNHKPVCPEVCPAQQQYYPNKAKPKIRLLVLQESYKIIIAAPRELNQAWRTIVQDTVCTNVGLTLTSK